MNTATELAILDFEVYLLMTTRIVMLNKKARILEAKLAEHGLSLDEAERIHDRVAEALGDKSSRFENIKNLLGIADRESKSLKYSSVLWPEFYFKATADEDGLLESARFWHAERELPSVDSPIKLRAWSMDVTEFTEHFGPMVVGQQWSLFDKLLPAHEGREFDWNGERYGAAFSWGLFLYVAELWD